MRTADHTRVVTLRADSLLSSKKTFTLNDAVDASEESEDDLGDEPREAFPQSNPVSPVIASECVGDVLRPDTVQRPLAREGYLSGSDRPRFLSLCRLLI
ncbi:hypothetical protein V5E97_10675 [Singulisphaera sp. Ch08]|uniref:Uncharacterized protein n=1 Tax=Singulisphaera sp. Ch08 TaxID=3120278 RepID=A0AAU7CN90_9BACT